MEQAFFEHSGKCVSLIQKTAKRRTFGSPLLSRRFSRLHTLFMASCYTYHMESSETQTEARSGKGKGACARGTCNPLCACFHDKKNIVIIVLGVALVVSLVTLRRVASERRSFGFEGRGFVRSGMMREDRRIRDGFGAENPAVQDRGATEVTAQ